MKHVNVYNPFVMILLFSFTGLYAVTPLILPRSQSEDSARELVGWAHYINLYDPEQFYGSIACTFEYEKTFSPENIGFNLFGPDLLDDTPRFIQIAGSQVGNRDETDWLADYFGLPTDFQSKLTFSPHVENVIVDTDFYFGFDQYLEGLYFRFHVPFVYTRWDLQFVEIDIQEGVNDYDPGYFGPTAVPRAQLLDNFTAFAAGRVPNLNDPITFIPLQNARIPTHKKTRTGVSEIQAAFGWNFLQADDHHFGLNLRTAFPTGNRPEGKFLFEPLVGNGHFWELGLGMTSHVLLYIDECTCRSMGAYFDANVTTRFATRQRRTFDLEGKPLSRYMLAQKLGTPVENLFLNTAPGTAANSVAPTAQFQNTYVPVADLTTFDVNVSIPGIVDATIMLDIAGGNWNFDLGYNFWARTCENIKPACLQEIPFTNNTTYALKGDARTYGFVAQDATDLPPGITPGQPIPLSATESDATIHSGTNTPIGTPFAQPQTQNPGIDLESQQWAMVYVATDNDSDQIVVLPTDTGGPATQQRSTLDPAFIQATDIDIEGAETKGLSNRIFGHVSYNWESCDCRWSAFIGAGGFFEMAHHYGSNHCEDPDFDESCQTCAFSQWGVWVKGGVGF